MSKTESNMNAHMTTGGTQVPAERTNQLGYPAKEFYFYAGNGLWTKVNPNEKTATQLKKENAQRKANKPKKPKKPSKQQLKDECKAMGLKVGGNMSQLQARLDNFYASLPSTDDLFVDDEGEVINPAKEESE